MNKSTRLIVILASAATIAAAALSTSSLHRGTARNSPSAASDSPATSDELVIPVGKGPGPILLADVNHDGHLDILVANTESETLSVLLGDGKGHFVEAAGSPFACGKGANDIAVGDMNGDGNPDVIIANTQTPYITILLGDGKGGFAPAPHSPFATTSRPHVHGVAVGDFMGDGKLSVVTDSWGNDKIILLPGDGHGNLLTPGKSFDADIHSDQGVRAADFNGDGKLDIVMTNQTKGAVGLMLGDGKGGFTKAPHSPFPAVQQAFAFAVGDVNGDGIPDVAVIPYDRDLTDPKQLGLVILLGDGKGGFTTMSGSPFSLKGCKGPDRIAMGDLNGDGLRDVVVSCAQSNSLVFFMGTRDGGFAISSRQLKEIGWSGLAIGDLNGDKKDDVVVSNNGSGTITILFSK
jgi:hypothetical protein